ncbi:MAG: rhomboid family intramembrane serine protease [Methanohalobium sp.]|uniref:rhomboid family intramembrane serine protease n=1 Tax=Methanohalobium sp. TaxID=2837493 RepID=UPI00397ABEAB
MIRGWDYKTFLTFFAIIPTILILIYLLPEPIKTAYFSLDPKNLFIPSIYLSAFVHFDLGHLLGNLIPYLIIMFLILNFTTDRKQFKWNMLSIYVDVPIITSLAYLFILILPLKSFGFSGIVSALIGLFLYTIYRYLRNRGFNLDFNFVWMILLINFFLFSLYLDVVFLMLAFIFVLTAVLIYLNKEFIREMAGYLKNLGYIRRKSRELNMLEFEYYVFLITLTVVFLFPFYIIVPLNPTQGGSIVNSLSHYIGYIYGILAPVLVEKWKDEYN